MNETRGHGRWRRTVALSTVTLIGAAALVDALAIAGDVEAARREGFPLGYVLTLALAPLFASGLIFWFARRQDAIDRVSGLGDE